MKLFPKKLCKRNKTCNYTLFHSGEKSFLTKSFYFNLKCFLTSSAYRRYFKDLFHKSVRAFLGLIGEAHITLSKAIALIQSFLPQFSSWSACNWLVSYLNASFTPMKTCESHLCWLTSYSVLHKRTEGNFTIGRTMATVPETRGSSSLHCLQPHTCSAAAPAGKTSLPMGDLLLWMFWSVQQEIRGRSDTRDPPTEHRKGRESPQSHSSLMIWVGKRLQVLSLKL